MGCLCLTLVDNAFNFLNQREYIVSCNIPLRSVIIHRNGISQRKCKRAEKVRVAISSSSDPVAPLKQSLKANGNILLIEPA